MAKTTSVTESPHLIFFLTIISQGKTKIKWHYFFLLYSVICSLLLTSVICYLSGKGFVIEMKCSFRLS